MTKKNRPSEIEESNPCENDEYKQCRFDWLLGYFTN